MRTSGNNDLHRSVTLRDSSDADLGEPAELGRHAAVFSVVDELDGHGLPSKVRQGRLQPRNWHQAIGDPLDKRFPNLKDRRFGIALISDHQHKPEGYTLNGSGGSSSPSGAETETYLISPGTPAHPGGANPFLDPPQPARPPVFGQRPKQKPAGAQQGASGDSGSPFGNDWTWKNKSTRIVDYANPRGRTALLMQLVKVVDDHNGQFAPALVLGRTTTGEDGSAGIAGGYLLDQSHGDQVGYLDSVFCAHNPQDITDTGKEGTPLGILGVRFDTHIELDHEHHGAIVFEGTDVAGYKEPSMGLLFKASMRFDSSAANQNSAQGHESGEWRPWFRVPFFFAEDGPTDGPGPGVFEDSTWAGAGGGVLLGVPLMSSATPPATAARNGGTWGYLAIAPQVDGSRKLLIAQETGVSTSWAELGMASGDIAGNKLTINNGLGVANHIIGPQDQPLAVVAGTPAAISTVQPGLDVQITAGTAVSGAVTGGFDRGGDLVFTAGDAGGWNLGSGRGGCVVLKVGTPQGSPSAGAPGLVVLFGNPGSSTTPAFSPGSTAGNLALVTSDYGAYTTLETAAIGFCGASDAAGVIKWANGIGTCRLQGPTDLNLQLWAGSGKLIEWDQATTGAGTASLASNCPATTATAPYTWLKLAAPDGSTVYVPAWK